MFAATSASHRPLAVVLGRMVGLAPLVAHRWRFFSAEKATPKGGFQIKADNSASYLVAGTCNHLKLLFEAAA